MNYSHRRSRRYIRSSSDATCRKAFNEIRELASNWSLDFDTPELIGWWTDDGDGLHVIRYKDVCEAVANDEDYDAMDLYDELTDIVGMGDAIRMYIKQDGDIPDWLVTELNDNTGY